MSEYADMIAPRARENFLAVEGFESSLADKLDAGALSNGWLVTGGEGAGKATLAFRLARALLWRDRERGAGLETPGSAQVFSLVASGGHPDLFVAERLYDEKKDRYATEITVETIRNLTHFLSHTPSMGGWRIAIIDTADDLNRNSANALLKVLEEPPPRSALFVLSSAPGRLLATIRSRCRRIDLRPPANGEVAAFLEREGAAKGAQASLIAEAAGGRPGFALRLAVSDGAEAISAVDEFLDVAGGGADAGPLAMKLAAKSADAAWPIFRSMLSGKLAARAKQAAMEEDGRASAIVDLREKIDTLFARGDAVNLDRMQTVLAAARAVAAARING